MNRDSLLMGTRNKPNHPTTYARMHAHMPACMRALTHFSSSLLALQAVSHPSIHVTERWVHPVTGQLVAVTLIYVAPLSFLFLLWWRNYVCLFPIRRVYSAHNGGLVWELSQTEVGRRAPAVNKLCDGFLAGQHHFPSFLLLLCHLNLDSCGVLSHCYSYTPQGIDKATDIPVPSNGGKVNTAL